MTQTELIQMAKRGERIPRQEHSLHDEAKNPPCNFHKNVRTIVCDGDWDVVECPTCGTQQVMGCNFDDEYA